MRRTLSQSRRCQAVYSFMLGSAAHANRRPPGPWNASGRSCCRWRLRIPVARFRHGRKPGPEIHSIANIVVINKPGAGDQHRRSNAARAPRIMATLDMLPPTSPPLWPLSTRICSPSWPALKQDFVPIKPRWRALSAAAGRQQRIAGAQLPGICGLGQPSRQAQLWISRAGHCEPPDPPNCWPQKMDEDDPRAPSRRRLGHAGRDRRPDSLHAGGKCRRPAPPSTPARCVLSAPKVLQRLKEPPQTPMRSSGRRGCRFEAFAWRAWSPRHGMTPPLPQLWSQDAAGSP